MRGVAARRKEKLLAVDLIGRDRVKARHRRKPFVPYPRVAVFDLWPFCRINENTAIGIEQNRVTFGKEIAKWDLSLCGYPIPLAESNSKQDT